MIRVQGLGFRGFLRLWAFGVRFQGFGFRLRARAGGLRVEPFRVLSC